MRLQRGESRGTGARFIYEEHGRTLKADWSADAARGSIPRPRFKLGPLDSKSSTVRNGRYVEAWMKLKGRG